MLTNKYQSINEHTSLVCRPIHAAHQRVSWVGETNNTHNTQRQRRIFFCCGDTRDNDTKSLILQNFSKTINITQYEAHNSLNIVRHTVGKFIFLIFVGVVVVLPALCDECLQCVFGVVVTAT